MTDRSAYHAMAALVCVHTPATLADIPLGSRQQIFRACVIAALETDPLQAMGLLALSEGWEAPTDHPSFVHLAALVEGLNAETAELMVEEAFPDHAPPPQEAPDG